MSWIVLFGVLGCGSTEEIPVEQPPPEETKTSTEYTIHNIDSLTLRTHKAKIFISPKMSLKEEHEKARTRLRQIVNDLGRDPNNPWALAHALLAFGPNTQTTNGQNAIDVIFTKYTEKYIVGNKAFVRFPRHIKRKDSKIRVEPHKDMMLKILTELNINPKRSYRLYGQNVSIEDFYKGTLLNTYIVPQKAGTGKEESSYANPKDIPWSIQALSAYAPQDLHWRSVGNIPMTMDDMADILASVAFGESMPLLKAYQAGAGIEKNKKHIFGHACGGSHLIQGLSATLSRGFGKMLKENDKGKDLMKQQVVLHFYRFPKELEYYDKVLKAYPEDKDKAITMMLQRLKYVGHFLETSAKLSIHGHYKATPNQISVIKGAMDQLALTVDALEKLGVLSDTNALKEKNEQQYLDLIGDSAHALYGLELISGNRGLWH